MRVTHHKKRQMNSVGLMAQAACGCQSQTQLFLGRAQGGGGGGFGGRTPSERFSDEGKKKPPQVRPTCSIGTGILWGEDRATMGQGGGREQDDKMDKGRVRWADKLREGEVKE